MRQLRSVWIHFFLVLFMGYYAGATLFPHVHNENGKIIVHSHPYSGSSSAPQHQHSSAQLQLIDHLMLLVLVATALFVLAALVRRGEFVHQRRALAYCSTSHLRSYPLRGPPSL